MTHGKVFTTDPNTNRYVWIGDTTHNSFKINIDVDADDSELLVSDSAQHPASRPAFTIHNPIEKVGKLNTKIYKNMRQLQVGNLQSKTQYYIFLWRKKDAKSHPGAIIRVGMVKTFPKELTRHEVIIGLGSCQAGAHHSRSLGEIALWREYFQTVRPNATFLMLHMGDLHYSNINVNDQSKFAYATRRVVTDSTARKLFSTMQVNYGWDDHDYGANNAGISSPSKLAALLNYKASVPHKTTKGDAIWYAFTVGKTRIILTDLRSEADELGDSIMSHGQMLFLKTELEHWKTFDTLVWMSSRPWIAKEKQGSDTWGGFARDRRTIANIIARERIDNLIVVSGDAHMVAADDGTNSMYADDKYTGQGFPVLHAAPLAQYGSSKGGPYSEGCKAFRLARNNHYALLRLDPLGGKRVGSVKMEFKAFKASGVNRWQDVHKKKAVLEYESERPFLAPGISFYLNKRKKHELEDDDAGTEGLNPEPM